MIEEEILKSALELRGAAMSLPEFESWRQSQLQKTEFSVREIPLEELKGWKFDSASGDLCHESGRFFSITGLSVSINAPHRQVWEQPIILQPEVGILGFIMKMMNGIPHFLMQLKKEPGNVNHAQLSPTVQATRSNYTRVHAGSRPPYLDYFLERRGVVVSDQLQSEQGARFLHKRNRNIILLVRDEIEVLDGFCWLTLGQVKRLYAVPNLVNMDARTVLSTLQMRVPRDVRQNFHREKIELQEQNISGIRKDLLVSLEQAEVGMHRLDDLISWFTHLKSTREITVAKKPLKTVAGWVRDAGGIHHQSGNFFSVVGVETRIAGREVAGWSQPLLKHTHKGLIGLLAKRIEGVLHFLVQARLEPGYIDIIEMGPTVTCGEPDRLIKENRTPRFMDRFINANPASILWDWTLSEEGGRFFQFQNRYMVVLMEDRESHAVPEDFAWMSYGQLLQFVRHSLYLNVELRSLVSGFSWLDMGS